MATALKNGGGGCGATVNIASTQTNWQTVNADLQTADTANLLKPQLVSRAAVTFLEVPSNATRMLIRGRNLIGMSATGTPTAVIRVFGASNGSPSLTSTTTPWGANPTAMNGAVWMRLDIADVNAAGLSITFATSAAAVNLEDGTYGYTDPVDLTGIDLKGCSWICVLVETACAVTGSAAVDAQIKFIN